MQGQRRRRNITVILTHNIKQAKPTWALAIPGYSHGSVRCIFQHRILVFAQLKSLLDIIERDVLSTMPSVTYLRLDGKSACV